MRAIVAENIERWNGFADLYDRVRPAPPAGLLKQIRGHAAVEGRVRVVDIASGTGLSTFAWADWASEVIGVEPSDDMRRIATATRTRHGISNVRFVSGISKQLPLPDACADIVTCSQALHWLEPDPTFAEVARILRAGGVFAAYDCDWPPVTGVPRADAAYDAFMAAASRLEAHVLADRHARRWDKTDHLERMRASRAFAFVREFGMHHEVDGDADRFIGIALTQSGPAALRKRGVPDDVLGVPALRAAACDALGPGIRSWRLSYRVRIGIRASD